MTSWETSIGWFSFMTIRQGSFSTRANFVLLVERKRKESAIFKCNFIKRTRRSGGNGIVVERWNNDLSSLESQWSSFWFHRNESHSPGYALTLYLDPLLRGYRQTILSVNPTWTLWMLIVEWWSTLIDHWQWWWYRLPVRIGRLSAGKVYMMDRLFVKQFFGIKFMAKTSANVICYPFCNITVLFPGDNDLVYNSCN